MASGAHARRARSTPGQVQRAGSGSVSTDERAEAEAEEREERQRRADQLLATRRADADGAGDDGQGGPDALARFARRDPSSPAAEVRALLDSGDLDHTLVLGGRVADLLRDERAASERLSAKHAEIAALERVVGTRLVPDDLRARDAAWDPERPQAWLERYAQGEDTELAEARRRLAELRAQSAEERQRVERLRPEIESARTEALRRAQGEDIEVLLLATRRLREHGAVEDADAAERALTDARAEHARATRGAERDIERLGEERDTLRNALGHAGEGGEVAAHAAEEERLRTALDEAAAPLAAVRGRMAELMMERDPRTRRRDRRLYARGSAKDLLEGSLARGHELRDAGGRAAESIAKRAGGRTRELLAGGLSRVGSLTDGPRPGLARRLIGGEGPERRRREDPESGGRSRRLPRRLRAQERRMARAYARAADAYARHVARAPQAGLLARLAAVEERLHVSRSEFQQADAALLDRLTGVRSRITGAAAGLGVSGAAAGAVDGAPRT
jgi:hypothetical protein